MTTTFECVTCKQEGKPQEETVEGELTGANIPYCPVHSWWMTTKETKEEKQ